MAKRFTKEEVEAAIQEGDRTYAALGRRFELAPANMKKAMEKLGLTLDEPKAAEEQTTTTITINSTSAEEINDWDALYAKYPNSHLQFLIAECKVKHNMTAAQAAKYMQENVTFTENEFKWSTFKEAQIRNRLERISRIRSMGNVGEYPWMKETYAKAQALGIDLAEYNLQENRMKRLIILQDEQGNVTNT